MATSHNDVLGAVREFVSATPDLYRLFGGRRVVFSLMNALGVLNRTCPRGHETSFRPDRPDTKMNYCSECRQFSSVLPKTFFSQHTIRAIDEFFLVLFIFCSRGPQGLSMVVGRIKAETVTKYLHAIYGVCAARVVSMKAASWTVGGRGKIVEVDEVHLATRKYFRGRVLVREHYWVVGVLEVDGGWVEIDDAVLYRKLVESERIASEKAEHVEEEHTKKQREATKPKANTTTGARRDGTMPDADADADECEDEIERVMFIQDDDGDETVECDVEGMSGPEKERIRQLFSQAQRGPWARNVLFFRVASRTEDSLLPIIARHVHPESIVMTDKWSAYEKLAMRYEAYTISHKHRFSRFVFRESEMKALRVTTNHIERCWVDVRRFLSGTQERHIQTKLDVESFRYLFLRSPDARENMVRFMAEIRCNGSQTPK